MSQKKLISLFCLLIILNCIYSQNVTNSQPPKQQSVNNTVENYQEIFDKSPIITVNDNNFDIVLKKNENNNIKLVILFTIIRCKSCSKILKTFENVQKAYTNNTDQIKFFKLNCFESRWTATRFSLQHAPAIMIFKNGFYSSYPLKPFTEEGIKEFIEDQNNTFKRIPEKIGMLTLFLKPVNWINDFIAYKFPSWNTNLGWVIVLVGVFGFFCLESYAIEKLCRKKKNNDKNKRDNNYRKGRDSRRDRDDYDDRHYHKHHDHYHDRDSYRNRDNDSDSDSDRDRDRRRRDDYDYDRDGRRKRKYD